MCLDPPVRPRPQPGQSIRRGLLRHTDPEGGQPRAGRVFYLPSSDVREGKQGRFGLQAQFLRSTCGGEAMRRQIQGLHLNQRGVENKLEGLFLVRVDRAHYRWHPQKPFVEIRFVVLEPKPFETRLFSGRLYCTEKALWKLNWFLRDFGYDTQLLKDDQVDEKALCKLRGVIRTSYTTLNGRSYQNLDAFAPEADWEALDCTSLAHGDGLGGNDGL